LGATYSPYVQGQQNHYFRRARDLMPLSAPCSESKEVFVTCSFRQTSARFHALRVFNGEISQPKPFDQMKLLSPPEGWFDVVPGREHEASGVAFITSFPLKVCNACGSMQ
jgi:hypothetical protein